MSIYKSKWLLSFILFSLITPNLLLTQTWFEMVRVVLFILSSSIVLLLIIFNKRISKYLIWVILFYSVILLSVYINNGSIARFFTGTGPYIVLCIVVVLWMEHSPETLLDAVAIMQIYVYINLLTVLLFPGGMYAISRQRDFWFLGYRNFHIRFILPVTAFSLVRSYYKYGKITPDTVVLIVTAIVTMLSIGSATGLVGFTIFIVMVLLFCSRRKPLPRFVNLYTIMIISTVLFFIIVVFGRQDLFAFLIEGILGRDLTLTGRLLIWERTMILISGNPIFGIGFAGRQVEFSRYMLYSNATHPHNYILYILALGGFLLLVITGWLYFSAAKKLKVSNGSMYSKIMLFAIASFLIMGISESLTEAHLLYPMILFACHIDVFINEES